MVHVLVQSCAVFLYPFLIVQLLTLREREKKALTQKEVAMDELDVLSGLVCA